MSWRRGLLWLLLALPAALMLYQLGVDGAAPMTLYHPTGELSIRLMVLALLPGPLAEFFGAGRFLRGWIAIRRNLGVAAFGYGLLHMVIYVLDMQMLAAMIDELELPSIWVGWLSFFALLVPAAISFDMAMRRLKRRWKQAQMLVYASFLLALVHWLLLGWSWGPALVHLAPLLLAWTLRLLARSGYHWRKLTT